MGIGGALAHPRELSAVAQAQPVSLQQLQSSLAEGELVIDYALNPSHSFALAITRDRIVHYELKSQQELEPAVALHLAAVRNRRDGRAEAKALYQLLLQPVTLMAQCRRVVIVPDGKLHLVAFEALLDPDGRYVVENHVISYAPSATVYYLLSRPMRSPTAQMALLAVGGARYTFPGFGNIRASLRGLFDRSGPPRWSAIPQSLTEAADVAAS